MSAQVEPVVEADEDQVTTVEQPPLVVDKLLVARLVRDAQRRACRSMSRVVCWRS